MDETAYLRALAAANDSLVNAWVLYCAYQNEEDRHAFEQLQRRLQRAAVHAQELNYRAAVEALPELPYASLSLTAVPE